jgi:hypothetical protein
LNAFSCPDCQRIRAVTVNTFISQLLLWLHFELTKTHCMTEGKPSLTSHFTISILIAAAASFTPQHVRAQAVERRLLSRKLLF